MLSVPFPQPLSESAPKQKRSPAFWAGLLDAYLENFSSFLFLSVALLTTTALLSALTGLRLLLTWLLLGLLLTRLLIVLLAALLAALVLILLIHWGSSCDGFHGFLSLGSTRGSDVRSVPDTTRCSGAVK